MRWRPRQGLCRPGSRCGTWQDGRHLRAAQRAAADGGAVREGQPITRAALQRSCCAVRGDCARGHGGACGAAEHSGLGGFLQGAWNKSIFPWFCWFFPGSIAKGSSSKSGCQLHLPTSHANLSRVTSPANFSCQLVESYFTCQLLMPTCRELLHLPTSHVNFLKVTSPANFSCQLFGCYLILLKAQANLSGVTSLS